jgi:Putative adhesin
MSNQEMQFADPDWKPSQQLDPKTGPGEREAYNPQPINTEYREQNQWRAAPPAPPQQEGYTGLRPYAGPPPQQMQSGNFRQRQYRRRGRGPWFWIILAIIIISLMSGGFGSSIGRFSRGDRFGGQSSFVEPAHVFNVTGQITPTIVINDNNGAIHVQSSNNQYNITVQSSTNSSLFGNPNNLPVTYNQSQDGNTINIKAPDIGQGSVDLQVTVPQGANLQLQTNSGDINVTGVDGQMTLTTDSGNIDASNDVINGTSTITTNAGDITAKQTMLSDQATISTTSGDINFNGTIGTTGTYQFKTDNGSVDLTVPSAPAFHVDASTTSGSINSSDFPAVQKSDLGSGAKATGDVGGSSPQPGAKLIINTGNGDINLHQG